MERRGIFFDHRSLAYDEDGQALPFLKSCTCDKRLTRVRPRFANEMAGLVGCTCRLMELTSCPCTIASWNGWAVSAVAGVSEVREIAEFDDFSRELLYSVGRHLHCVVRFGANRIDDDHPLESRLDEYERGVFAGKPQKPLNLEVPMFQLEAYFLNRTKSVHRDIVKKYRKERNRHVSLGEILSSHRALYASMDEPLIVRPEMLHSEPGQILYEIYHSERRAWRSNFQVVCLLVISGLAGDTNEAYDLIINAGWPPVTSQLNLRSQFYRGARSLRRRLVDPNLDQVVALEAYCRENGASAGVPYLISHPDDQAGFKRTFGGLR